MSKISRAFLTVGIIGAVALSAPLLASQFQGHAGDHDARHGHHGHKMMARSHGEGEGRHQGGYRHKGRHHEHVANMSDEERGAYREQKRVQFMAMRMHWDTLSDAEKENYRVQARTHMDERRAAWEAMSDEERQARREEMRQKMQERRGEMGGHRH
jgi:hypothetical protein